MKKIFFSVIFLPMYLFSQNKSGTITYTLLDVKKLTTIDSIITTKNRIEIAKTLKFNLNFDNASSEFCIAEPLKLGVNILNFAKTTSTVNGVYINTYKKSKIVRYAEYEDFGGKLAIENTNIIKWKLTSEKKIISGYECYLAIGTFKDYERFVRDYNLEAWYCPKIPISLGPKYYCGLPGLIMEITDNKVTFGVEKIEFKNKVKFNNFDKSKYKVITDVKYHQMITDYIEELMKGN